MRVERLLGRVNGFCGCEANRKKAKSKAHAFKTESIGHLVQNTVPPAASNEVSRLFPLAIIGLPPRPSEASNRRGGKTSRETQFLMKVWIVTGGVYCSVAFPRSLKVRIPPTA